MSIIDIHSLFTYHYIIICGPHYYGNWHADSIEAVDIWLVNGCRFILMKMNENSDNFD